MPSTCCATTRAWDRAREGFIWEHELADWRWGFDVNVWGVIHGIKAFVPDMVARGEPGHVVNTSSRATAASYRSATPRSTRRRSPRSSRSPSRCTRTCCGRSRPCARRCSSPGRTGCARTSGRRGGGGPRNTPKTVPRQTPYPSLDQLEQIMAERGVELEWTPLEEVAGDRRARHPRRAVLDAAAERHDRRVDPGPGRVDARAARTRPTSATGRNRRSEHRALHGHLGRRSRRRVGPDVPRVPRCAVARRVRRVGATYSNPFDDLAGSNAYRNWDQRRARRRARGRRHRRRGAVPEHDPAVLPVGRARHAARRTRPSTSTGGPGYRRTTAGSPTSARPHPVGARASRRSCSTTSTTPLAEVEFAHDAGLFGGVLLPGVPPNHEIPPLWSDVYEPLWARCEELDIVVNHHSGGGLPAFDVSDPAARAVMLVEIPIYAHRALWALDLRGRVRAPPAAEVRADRAGHELGTGHARQPRLVHEAHAHHDGGRVPLRRRRGRAAVAHADEYFQRNCWIGASFLRPIESALRHDVGVDRIMWGSDYPHSEGSYPYSREALRAAFADAPEAEVRTMCADAAAGVYGFDLDQLDPIADARRPDGRRDRRTAARVPGRLDVQRVRPRRHRPHLVNDRGTDQMSWVHDPVI